MLNLLFTWTLLNVVSLSKAVDFENFVPVEVDLKQPSLTRVIKIREHLSTTVAVGMNLYTIFYNTSHIRIKSTDKDYRSCSFPAASFSNNNQIYAAVLESKLRFVVWSIYRSEFHNKTIDVQSTMFIVNPWDCNYKNVRLPVDHQPRWYQRINLNKFDYPHGPQVVTYSHSFDVFFGGPNVCSPCRFNIDGGAMEMRYQIDPDRFDAQEASYIQDVELAKGTRGYFQICRLTDFTTEIKILDRNFSDLEDVRFHHVISVMDVDQGEEPTIVFCYLSRYPKPPTYPKAIKSPPDFRHVYCKKYDTDLDRLFTVRMPLPIIEAYPASFSLSLDSSGHTFVTYEAPYGKFFNSTKLVLFQYDNEGNLMKSLDFSHSNGTTKIVQGSVITSSEFCLISWVKRNGKDSCNKIIECIAV